MDQSQLALIAALIGVTRGHWEIIRKQRVHRITNFHIVVESKAWNHAEIWEGRINTRWENELDFDIIEYQVRNEKDNVVYRSNDEDDVINWMAGKN